MQHSKLCDLSKSSPFENVHVINLFDAEGSNQVQIELMCIFLYMYCMNILVFQSRIFYKKKLYLDATFVSTDTGMHKAYPAWLHIVLTKKSY